MNDLYLQHLFYMRLSEWHSPPSCTCINNSIFCTTQGRTPAHLWVDDADGGFAPDVSLVSLRRRCVEAQDCVVRIWKRKQVLEVMNWPFSAHGPAQNTHTHIKYKNLFGTIEYDTNFVLPPSSLKFYFLPRKAALHIQVLCVTFLDACHSLTWIQTGTSSRKNVHGLDVVTAESLFRRQLVRNKE